MTSRTLFCMVNATEVLVTTAEIDPRKADLFESHPLVGNVDLLQR